MSHAPRIPDYLQHILAAIARIERYTTDTDTAAFLADEQLQDAVIRNIEIIGEAANNVMRADPAYAARHNHIPWLVIYTMRNRVAHGYHSVDLDMVWKTVQHDLPVLREQIQTLTKNS